MIPIKGKEGTNEDKNRKGWIMLGKRVIIKAFQLMVVSLNVACV